MKELTQIVLTATYVDNGMSVEVSVFHPSIRKHRGTKTTGFQEDVIVVTTEIGGRISLAGVKFRENGHREELEHLFGDLKALNLDKTKWGVRVHDLAMALNKGCWEANVNANLNSKAVANLTK
jgi:hypothetical protein